MAIILPQPPVCWNESSTTSRLARTFLLAPFPFSLADWMIKLSLSSCSKPWFLAGNIQTKPILNFLGAKIAVLGRPLLTYYPKGAMTLATY